MTIKPNGPWYPPPYKLDEQCPHGIMGGCEECLGVPIRLKLAAEMAKGILAGVPDSYDLTAEARSVILADAEFLADDLIERAIRDEGKPE